MTENIIFIVVDLEYIHIHFNIMLRKIIGYVFATIGFIGSIFFEHYKGHVIPYPWLWFIISIATALAGIYLISLSKLEKILKEKKKEAEQL